MRHARQQTDITHITTTRKAWDSIKNKSQAKKWAKAEGKSKKSGILKKRNMATTLSKLTIQERNPQVEMDSEITRLREEIEQERQMK
jgi:lipopolysaccharide biosynthesis glycosyltransferase